MKRVDRWQANDGSIWETPEKATERDDLIAECAQVAGELTDRPEDTDYSNGRGYVQQPRGARKRLEAHLTLLGWHRDSSGPVGRLGWRLHCMDDQDREWGQPYFGLNPDMAERKEAVLP